MLSVGRREDGRKGGLGLGLGYAGGRMEENELEEGEACSGQDDGDHLSPDGLSYIDEKLQDVLGHFQKDFEGGVSQENLGAMFGGYGSFLPTYSRSPLVSSHPRSPPRGGGQNLSKSPYNSSSEGARQNLPVPMNSSALKNNNNLAFQPLNTLSKTNMSKLTSGEPVSQYDSINKPCNASNQKTLKVRIKLGSESVSAKKNAAIYSGLGLDISPSSSLEGSPEETEGLFPESRDAPDVSPMTILKIMTSFPLPEGCLLSPLPNDVLNMPMKESSTTKHCKSGSLQRNIPEVCVGKVDALSSGDVTSSKKKKTKPDERIGSFSEVKSSESKDDISTLLRKEIDNETSEGQRLVNQALNISILSSSRNNDEKEERNAHFDSAKGTSKMMDYSKEPNKISVPARISSPDDQLEFMESVKNGAVTSSKNNTSHSRGKSSSTMSSEERMLDERSKSNGKNPSSDIQREQSVKVGKDYHTIKFNSFGHNTEKKNHIIEPRKKMSAHRATSYEQDGERVLQDQSPRGRIKQKEGLTKDKPAGLNKVNPETLFSTEPKEKKKSSRARDKDPENKPTSLRLHKEISKGRSKESHRDIIGDPNAEQLHYGTEFLERAYTERNGDVKLENDKGSFVFDKAVGKKVGNPPNSEAFVDASASTRSASNAPVSNAAAELPAPVVIKENWVACDKCQEWRLLPYGMNPGQLPKKWKCNMQTWLPGLNRCHISEQETTKALNAMYQIPVIDNDAKMNSHREDVAAAVITTANALHIDQKSQHNTGKKKLGLKDDLDDKGRLLNDMHEYPSETNLSTDFSLGRTGKSTEFGSEKRNEKLERHKIMKEKHADDFSDKSDKHLKSKSKRKVDPDGFTSSKKIKKEGSYYPDDDRRSNHNMNGRSALSMENAFSSKAIVESSKKCDDYSSTKDLKHDKKSHLPASVKMLKDEVVELKDVKMEISGIHDSSAKKRKIEWQASQGYQNPMSSQHVLEDGAAVKEASTESELMKQNKVKPSKSEGRESGKGIVGDTLEKDCSKGKLLCGSREQLSNSLNGGTITTGKEQLRHDHGSLLARRTLDCTDYSKKDMGYAQPLAAATSSSSKVSGSCKIKANFQETRGSPVESVSSSPLRISNTKKLSTRRNSTEKNDDANAMRCFKRNSEGEVDGGSYQSGTQKKEKISSVPGRISESHRASGSSALDSLNGTHNFHSEEANRISSAKATRHAKGGAHGGLSPLLYRESLVNDTGNISDRYNKYDCEGSDEDNTHELDKMNKHHHVNGLSQQKSGKGSSCSKEKHISSKSDGGKNKVNASNIFREQNESHVSKIGSSRRTEVDVDSHGRSTHYRDLLDGPSNAQEKRDEKDFSGKKDLSVKRSIAGRRDGHSNYAMQENLDTRGPSKIVRQHEEFDSGAASCSKSDLQETFQRAPSRLDEKSSSLLISDRVGRPEFASSRGSEFASSRGKSQSTQPSKDKHEAHGRAPQIVPSVVQGSRAEVNPIDAVNCDSLKAIKQPRKPDSQNGPRQATPNDPNPSSPMRKDGHPAATAVLKEARDLKHTANHLKNEGLGLESTGLYFEAALKFLHVASLLEPPSFETVKLGDSNQSVNMYSETAKLCEYCALEYEKYRELAAAALAFKCVEVAYMKVAYYKHTNANKDRHELQAALQMVLPGESPSSSASDVDNLNNQGALDKAASTKGTASPQIAGNHVIAARNRPKFLRLLNYTDYLNSAFEASRKSQKAIAAALANHGREGVDGMSSVKEVLDFNFQNVEGLLRLVRVSMESISR